MEPHIEILKETLLSPSDRGEDSPFRNYSEHTVKTTQARLENTYVNVLVRLGRNLNLNPIEHQVKGLLKIAGHPSVSCLNLIESVGKIRDMPTLR